MSSPLDIGDQASGVLGALSSSFLRMGLWLCLCSVSKTQRKGGDNSLPHHCHTEQGYSSSPAFSLPSKLAVTPLCPSMLCYIFFPSIPQGISLAQHSPILPSYVPSMGSGARAGLSPDFFTGLADAKHWPLASLAMWSFVSVAAETKALVLGVFSCLNPAFSKQTKREFASNYCFLSFLACFSLLQLTHIIQCPTASLSPRHRSRMI